MKINYLLATALLLPTISFASEAPKLTVGGRMETMLGYVNAGSGYDQLNPSVAGSKIHKFALVNDTKIDFKVDGYNKFHNLKYGGLIRLHADTSRATNKETSVGDKTMVYLQNDKIGRFEAGNMPGAGGLFEMEILFFNKGSWGVDGFWSQWITDKTKRTSGLLGGALSSLETRGIEFIVSPNLPSNYSGHHYSDAPKVSFFTKPLKQVTLGVSYIDDMDSTGTVSGRSTPSGGPVDTARSTTPKTFKEIVSGGVVLEDKITKDLQYKLALVGEAGRSKFAQLKDLRAMEVGAMFTYKQTRLGASYGDWFDSYTLRSPLSGSKHNANYWTLGFGQDIGKFGYSLTYMESTKSGGLEVLNPSNSIPAALVTDFKDNKFNNFVVDVDYELAKGILPYIAVSNYSFKESTGAKDQGHVVIFGTRLLF